MGTQRLAEANAIMKRLRSTETLGSTSAINSDKTGTLTLNQMTAVELTIPGRQYTIDGNGYSTEGRIKRVAGQSDVDLEQFMLPLILASDAVVHDGEMIGDPTEGALVVLGEKGGFDSSATREKYPRVAELPFDTAYKLMATFHRMKDESGQRRRPLLRQGRARPGARPRLDDAQPGRPASDRRSTTRCAGATRPRTRASASRACACSRRRARTSTRRPSIRTPTCSRCSTGLTLLALVGIVDPPRPTAKDAIAKAHAAGIQVRMITGDHAVTAAAIANELGHQGPGHHRRRVRRDERRGAAAQIDEIGVIARVDARGQGPPRRHPEAARATSSR